MSNSAADEAYRTHAGLSETERELERDPIIAVTGEDIPVGPGPEVDAEPPHDPPAEPVGDNDAPNPPQTEIGEPVEPGVDETVAL